jgi:hypothetical protein
MLGYVLGEKSWKGSNLVWKLEKMSIINKIKEKGGTKHIFRHINQQKYNIKNPASEGKIAPMVLH